MIENINKRIISIPQNILLFIGIIFLSGCAVQERPAHWEYKDNPVYMCTKTDFKNFKDPFDQMPFWWSGSYLPMWMSVPIQTIGNVVTIIDIPISLVVDTVCLPIDINQKNKNSQNISQKATNATAMYAQNTGFKYPVLNTPIGYDLEKGDLVIPYGEVFISDFIFICNNQYSGRGKFHTSVTITFPNVGDGIRLYNDTIKHKHRYVWPPAPTEGYKNKLYKFSSSNWGELSGSVHNILDNKGHSNPQGGDYNHDEQPCYYIFRVRTKLDDSGNIISAKYGKIQGDFNLAGVAGGGAVNFTYYYNPDGTPNLEFDHTNNLFKWPKTNRKERNRAHEKTMNLKL